MTPHRPALHDLESYFPNCREKGCLGRRHVHRCRRCELTVDPDDVERVAQEVCPQTLNPNAYR